MEELKTVLVDFAGTSEEAKLCFGRYGKFKSLRKVGPVYTFIEFERGSDAKRMLCDPHAISFKVRLPKANSVRNKKKENNMEEPKSFGTIKLPKSEVTNEISNKETNNDTVKETTPVKYQIREKDSSRGTSPDIRFVSEANRKLRTNIEKVNTKTIENESPNNILKAVDPATNNKENISEIICNGMSPNKTEQVSSNTKQNENMENGTSELGKLLFIQDMLDYENMRRGGLDLMIGVVIANFPIYYMQCDIYTLCNPIVKVLHVDIRNNMSPFEIPFAYVYVSTDIVADFLVKEINKKWWKGKQLLAFKVSDVANPEDIIQPPPLE